MVIMMDFAKLQQARTPFPRKKVDQEDLEKRI